MIENTFEQKRQRWQQARAEIESSDATSEGYISSYWEKLAQTEYKWTILACFEGDDAAFYTAGRQIVELNQKYKLFSGESTVLDLGCGAGRLGFNLQGLVKRYIGVDVSPTMLEKAQSVIKDPVFEFKLGNGHDLAFIPDASLDAAYSLLVLQHMPADIMYRHFDEFSRIIKPRGRLLFQLPYPGAYPEKRTQDTQLWAAEAYPKRTIAKALKKRGFSLDDYFVTNNEQGKPFDHYFVCTKR